MFMLREVWARTDGRLRRILDPVASSAPNSAVFDGEIRVRYLVESSEGF